MRNAYFLARHGKSLANEQEIILGDPEYGTTGFGLTEEGKTQVRTSAEKAKKEEMLDSTAVIISSDFTRTRETADIIAAAFGVPHITLTTKLRERNFGSYERTHNSNYQNVWDKDQNDADHTDADVESVNNVLDRTKALIDELEDQYDGKNIILVSHGDALQILQTIFEGVHSSQHRSLRHLNIAEIRKIKGSFSNRNLVS